VTGNAYNADFLSTMCYHVSVGIKFELSVKYLSLFVCCIHKRLKSLESEQSG